MRRTTKGSQWRLPRTAYHARAATASVRDVVPTRPGPPPPPPSASTMSGAPPPSPSVPLCLPGPGHRRRHLRPVDHARGATAVSICIAAPTTPGPPPPPPSAFPPSLQGGGPAGPCPWRRVACRRHALPRHCPLPWSSSQTPWTAGIAAPPPWTAANAKRSLDRDRLERRGHFSLIKTGYILHGGQNGHYHKKMTDETAWS